MTRVFANIVLFVSVLFSPWWITVTIGIAFAIFFRASYEVIFWAFFADLLYGTTIAAFPGSQFFLTVSTAATVFIVDRVKRMTRFY